MWEFNRQVECPHCGNEQWECLAFDSNQADDHGVNSEVQEFECHNYEDCGKKFWTKAYLEFQIDDIDTFTKEPK